MAIIEEQLRIELLTLGRSKAHELAQPVLVSFVKKITKIDPLLFFASKVAESFATRFFWSTPTRKIELVALGELITFVGEGEERFLTLKKSWETLSALALTNTVVNGTGPLLLGGFSFDPLRKKTDLWENFPDAKLFLPQFILSQIEGEYYLTSNVMVDGDTSPEHLLVELNQRENELLITEPIHIETIITPFFYQEQDTEQWLQAIKKMAAEIKEGKLEKIVLAREMKMIAQFEYSPAQVLYQLYHSQPMTYTFSLIFNQQCFIGASPERLVKKTGQRVTSSCLAGTTTRGETISEDERLGQMLLQDKKNLHEHEVVVRMIKQLISKGCQDVQTPPEPMLYKLRHIQHLYTPVIGRALEKVTLFDLISYLHPTPALGGYPREEAMKRIREEEALDRGWYASPLGWIDQQGNGEFIAAIRSALLRVNEATLFAGCGIVLQSLPDSEYFETLTKFKTMLTVLSGKSLNRED